MMQGNLLTFLILWNVTSILNIPLYSQSIENKILDEKLIGIWKGIESNQQIQGMEKLWEMTRYPDGTYSIKFKIDFRGYISESLEKGEWWIENGKYHEKHHISQDTDIYDYKILDGNKIRFELLESPNDFNNQNYQFVDTLIEAPYL